MTATWLQEPEQLKLIDVEDVLLPVGFEDSGRQMLAEAIVAARKLRERSRSREARPCHEVA